MRGETAGQPTFSGEVLPGHRKRDDRTRPTGRLAHYLRPFWYHQHCPQCFLRRALAGASRPALKTWRGAHAAAGQVLLVGDRHRSLDPGCLVRRHVVHRPNGPGDLKQRAVRGEQEVARRLCARRQARIVHADDDHFDPPGPVWASVAAVLLHAYQRQAADQGYHCHHEWVNTTPAWIPLVVAGLSVVGTLTVGFAGGLIAQRWTDRRDSLHLGHSPPRCQ